MVGLPRVLTARGPLHSRLLVPRQVDAVLGLTRTAATETQLKCHAASAGAWRNRCRLMTERADHAE